MIKPLVAKKSGPSTLVTALWILVVLLTQFTITDASTTDDGIRNAIVKIYASYNNPDFLNPWRAGGSSQTSGSGAVISGNRILTNAHIVANSTYIQVRLHGQSRKFKAKVLRVAHEVDLALLTIDEPTFFQDVTPLELGELPEAQQEVLVYGFPIGGDSLSITKGILSRIEHQNYVHSGSHFLAGQIDAAINPGNSGGPVIVEDKIAGVVMQAFSPRHSENLGYMVPSPVIRHFLDDIKDSRYDGFPAIGLNTQTLDSLDMKRMLGMKESQTGVVINHIHYGSPAEGKLKADDVLMKVDGHPVSDNGTVEFRPKERTYYAYYIEMHQMGEKVEFEVLRKGKVKHVRLTLKNRKDDFRIVPNKNYDQLPRFFIYGGIVFSPLTKNLLEQWGRAWRHAAPSELITEMSSWPDSERRELVVAIKVLAADVNRGYHKIKNWVVTEVNGKPFRDFDEFYRLVMMSKEPFTVFKNKKAYQIIIDDRKAKKTHPEILKAYRINQDRSKDLPSIK